jgi:hypothetical protein
MRSEAARRGDTQAFHMLIACTERAVMVVLRVHTRKGRVTVAPVQIPLDGKRHDLEGGVKASAEWVAGKLRLYIHREAEGFEWQEIRTMTLGKAGQILHSETEISDAGNLRRVSEEWHRVKCVSCGAARR